MFQSSRNHRISLIQGSTKRTSNGASHKSKRSKGGLQSQSSHARLPFFDRRCCWSVASDDFIGLSSDAPQPHVVASSHPSGEQQRLTLIAGAAARLAAPVDRRRAARDASRARPACQSKPEDYRPLQAAEAAL